MATKIIDKLGGEKTASGTGHKWGQQEDQPRLHMPGIRVSVQEYIAFASRSSDPTARAAND